MKVIKIISILFVFAFIMQSCDKVEPPYQTGFDCKTGNQKVLIEDYTGHTCLYCPTAAVTAHEIKSNCEDRIIIIAVHAGPFAKPSNSGYYTYDFRTEAGTEWNNFFGLPGYPNGLVNRMNESGNYILGYGQWAEATTKLLAQYAPVNITISNEFAVADSSLTTKIDANFIGAVDGNYKLLVCITEDSIIKPQKNQNENIGETPDILNYEHMHVLRKAVNGVWGQDFIAGSISPGETVSKTYEQSFEGTDWVAENCHVVAYIYNEADKSILQVEETKVIE